MECYSVHMTLRALVCGFAGALIACMVMLVGRAGFESRSIGRPWHCYIGCFGGNVEVGKVEPHLCNVIATGVLVLIVGAGAVVGVVVGQTPGSRQ